MNRLVFVCIIASLAADAIGYRQGGDSSSEEGRCQCSTTEYNKRTRTSTTTNLCTNNTGATNMCGSGKSYLTCNDATCSSVNCPANTLWNQKKKACVSCAAGFHVAAAYPLCICDRGTTFDRNSKTCIACPHTANSLEDSWFNFGLTYFPVKDWPCRGCPGLTGSLNRTSMNSEWQLTVQTYKVCQCFGDNEIVDVISFSCLTCPANSTAVNSWDPFEQDWCSCNISGQGYNPITNTCSCPPYLVLNTAGTACQHPASPKG